MDGTVESYATGSLDADWSLDNGHSSNGDGAHPNGDDDYDDDIYIEGDEDNYVMIDDVCDEDYSGKKMTPTSAKSPSKRATGIGSRGPYKKKKHVIDDNPKIKQKALKNAGKRDKNVNGCRFSA